MDIVFWAGIFARVLLILAINAVPIWGFERQDWSPGTILALYWLQTMIGIPVTATLILMHRRMTHKLGHYRIRTVTSVNHGPPVVSWSTYLSTFLQVSIAFTIAHGVFLAFLLGVIWRQAAGGVDLGDLRLGLVAMLNLMALHFAVDTVRLRERPFAWIRYRGDTLLQRTLVVHMAILIGMAVAVFSDRDSLAFFSVFLVLKLLADLSAELPQWDPKEPPAWMARLLNRIGGAGSDFAGDWRRMRIEQKAGEQEAERTLEELPVPERPGSITGK